MKNLLKNTIACAIVLTTCFNCSVESLETEQFEESSTQLLEIQDPCSGQDPQASITNNGTIAITLEIATTDGVILHTVSDLLPGASSSVLTFAPADIIFNVIKNTTGITDDKVFFTMDECTAFDMEVAPDNYLLPGAPVSL